MPHPLGTSTDTILPPQFAAWMRELLPEPVPDEPLATCLDCPMCEKPGGGANPLGVDWFRPDTKCCTYIPELPNFLAGRVLRDDDPAAAEGRASLERRIATGTGVTPMSVSQPPEYTELYGRHRAGLFGRTLAMRCPHYLDRDGGLCGIWKHRNSVCATWFCLHDRGPTAKTFWEDLRLLLGLAERAVALACVERLGVDVDAVRAMFAQGTLHAHVPVTPAAIDRRPDPAFERRVWGRWAGRPVEFYRACAEVAGDVSWADVQQLGGVELAMRERVLLRAFADLVSREVPPLLRFADVRQTRFADGRAELRAGDRAAPVDVPAALADALLRFDGRTPTGEVLLDIAIATRQAMPSWLVRRLVDRGILVPPADAPSVTPPADAFPGVATAARRLPILAG